MRVTVEVKVGDGGVDGSSFSRATLMGESVEQQVRDAVKEDLTAIFREHPAFDYYTSKYANGTELPRPPLAGGKSFAGAVQDALALKLRERFGLVLSGLEVQPFNDPYVKRLSELMSRTIDCEIDASFARGGPSTRIQVTGFASIYVESIDPAHWGNFYPQVERYDYRDHEDEIKKRLINAVRKLESIIVRSDIGQLNTAQVRQQIEERVIYAIRADCGLVTRIDLHLTIRRPSPGLMSEEKIDQLRQELHTIWAARTRLLANMVDNPHHYSEEDLQRLNSASSEKESELARAAEAEEAAIQRTETVLIGRHDGVEALDEAAERPNPGS